MDTKLLGNVSFLDIIASVEYSCIDVGMMANLSISHFILEREFAVFYGFIFLNAYSLG